MLTMEELMAMALRQVAVVFDHLHHKRLAAGHVECVDQALHHAESQQPGMVMYAKA